MPCTQFIEKRGVFRGARAIVQGIISANLGKACRHRHDRRDADPAGDQDIGFTGLVERKVVAWRRGLQDVPDCKPVMQINRTAEAVGLAQHTNDVLICLRAVIEQRIGSGLFIRQFDVDMSSRREGWQSITVCR